MSLLTVEEVARRLNVSKDVVYRLCSRKEASLSHHRIGSARGAIRIPEEAVEEYLARSMVPLAVGAERVEKRRPEDWKFLRKTW